MDLIVVSLRKLEAPESLYTLFDEMGVVSIEHISDQLALTGLPDKGYPLSTSGFYPAFRVRFGSKNEAEKAKACAQGIALKSFSPENSLFIFNAPQDGDQHSRFNVGNGAFHALMFSIYKKFAEFGSISLLYPNKPNGGWIIHFDDEHRAEEARFKTLKKYEKWNVVKIDMDPELKHFNSHLKLEFIPNHTGVQIPTVPSGSVEIRRNIPAQTSRGAPGGVGVRKFSGYDEPAFAYPFEFIPFEEILWALWRASSVARRWQRNGLREAAKAK